MDSRSARWWPRKVESMAGDGMAVREEGWRYVESMAVKGWLYGKRTWLVLREVILGGMLGTSCRDNGLVLFLFEIDGGMVPNKNYTEHDGTSGWEVAACYIGRHMWIHQHSPNLTRGIICVYVAPKD